MIFFTSCEESPSAKIIIYAKEKFGKDFKSGQIDLSKVFKFKWEKMYLFSPLAFPEDVSKAIHIKYNGEIVPDNCYLFLFVGNNKIVKEYRTCYLRIGFSDNENTGVYEVSNINAKYEIKFLSENNYWLYKLNEKTIIP